MNPQPDKLVIYRKADSIQIDDGSGRERALDWGNSNASYPDSARISPARWDGKKLVAEMKGRRGSRSVTYEMDSSGQNLTVTMKFQRPDDGETVTLKSRYTKYEGKDE